MARRGVAAEARPDRDLRSGKAVFASRGTCALNSPSSVLHDRADRGAAVASVQAEHASVALRATSRSKFFDHGAEHPDDGLLLLGPAATNRTWFWSCAGDMIAWLKPITFVGFSSTFPKALALHYYGAEQLRFRDVCRDSGLVVRVSCSRSERL